MTEHNPDLSKKEKNASLRAMFSQVSKCKLPPYSRLHQRISDQDFIDCFSVTAKATPRHASDIITSFPGWAGFLLGIRRRIVTGFFGLLHEGESSDKVGPFPVETESEEEIIAGFDDKHLEFRVSVISKDGKVYLATWVHPHNLFGWLYLRAIMPFHILIAREALARVQEKTQQSPNIYS